jgi:hypothetical protein
MPMAMASSASTTGAAIRRFASPTVTWWPCATGIIRS